MGTAALSKALTELIDDEPTSIDDTTLSKTLVALEELQTQFDAAQMALLVEADRRKLATKHRVRSQANWLADATRQSPTAMGSRLKTGKDLTTQLPLVFQAMQMAVISTAHARLIRRFMLRRGLRQAVIRDQALFLGWAQEQWPVFERNMEMWGIANDPIDPHEQAQRAFADRSAVYAQIGESVLLEAMIPALMWEQIIIALQPHLDRLFEEDWAEAKARLGDDAEISAADLLRTDRQRFVDALVIALRSSAGASDPGVEVVVNLVADLASVQRAADQREAAIADREAERVRAEVRASRAARQAEADDAVTKDDTFKVDAAKHDAANGSAGSNTTPGAASVIAEHAVGRHLGDDSAGGDGPGDDDIGGVDPRPLVRVGTAHRAETTNSLSAAHGVDPEYAHLFPSDEECAESDALLTAFRRQIAAGEVLADDAEREDIELMRCRTESGLTISPDTALMGALAGSIRRFTLGLPNLDFQASKKARLFKGAKRLGIMIRDEHCQGVGCDTPAAKCQADHIVPHSRGGPTLPVNGDAKCVPCHNWKTQQEALGLL